MSDEAWDAVIVGGGPAGLSAALWLARYRRRTLIVDDERPRNEAAWAVHGFPGLADPTPGDLRARLADQALTAGAVLARCRVDGVRGSKDSFLLDAGAEGQPRARRVVLAYGRRDRLPDVPRLREFYGTSVFHCPDCDGPSVAGCDVVVIGHDRAAAGLALYLLTWASRVTLLTNGLEPALERSTLGTLSAEDVGIRTERVATLEGEAGRLAQVRLEGGAPLAANALFFHWGTDPGSTLAHRTGCETDIGGDIRVDPKGMETSIPGIHAAGDIIGHPHLAIIAAAQGVQAALAIHRSLLPDAFAL